MPGTGSEESLDQTGQEDFDDIQTLKNLLELRSSLRTQDQFLDESID